jgi:WD40 repeat protein
MARRLFYISVLCCLFSLILPLSSCDDESTGYRPVTEIVSGDYHCEFLRWNPDQNSEYNLAFWGSDFAQNLDLFIWDEFTKKITKMDLYWDSASKKPVQETVYAEDGFCWLLPSWDEAYLLCSVEVDAEGTTELWQIDVTTGLTEKIATPHNQPIYYPDVSWDGGWLTYCSDNNATWGVWKVHIEQTMPLTFIGEPVQLTFDNGWYPRWSPVGGSIAYVGWCGEGYVDVCVYTIPASGGSPTQITPDGQAGSNWIAWSPDGDWLVYSSFEGGDLWMIPSTGGTPQQITDSPSPVLPSFPAMPT